MASRYAARARSGLSEPLLGDAQVHVGAPVARRDAHRGLQRRDGLRVLPAGRVGHRQVVVHHHVPRRLVDLRLPEREVAAPLGRAHRRSDAQRGHQGEDGRHHERRPADRSDQGRRGDAEPRGREVGEPLGHEHADGEEVQHREQCPERPEDPRRGQRVAAQEGERARHQRQPGEHREEQLDARPGDELDPRGVREVGSQEGREGEQPHVFGQDATRGVGHRGARHPGEPLGLERHPPRHPPQERGTGPGRAGAPPTPPRRGGAPGAPCRPRSPARRRFPRRPERPPRRSRRGAGRPRPPRSRGWRAHRAPRPRRAVRGCVPPRARRSRRAGRPARRWSRAAPCAPRWARSPPRGPDGPRRGARPRAPPTERGRAWSPRPAGAPATARGATPPRGGAGSPGGSPAVRARAPRSWRRR